MARLIPPVPPGRLKSPGEALIFELFAKDVRSTEWTVIHSFDLPEHVRQVSGEADFVVVAPELGVLVIEVKGVDTVRRDSGLWFLGHHGTGEGRGPFRQAEDAMLSVRKRLVKRVPDAARVPMWWCVVFPFLRFDLPAVEWHDWEVIDTRDLRANGLAGSLQRVLIKAREVLSTRLGYVSDGPAPALADRIVNALRGDFEIFESPRDRLARADADVLHYTQEQFRALDAMDLNERVLFSGPAGTGKTVLASEAARREALTGRRTLLLCLNRSLAHVLGEQLEGIAGLEVSSFHAKLLSITRAEVVDTADFWTHDLPVRAADALLKEEGAYESLVIDELQDLLHENYFDCLDLLIGRGLKSGRWRAFGDVASQRLYAATLPIESLLARLGSGFVRFQLTVNCRNTPRIAALAGRIADVPECYAHVRRADDGRDPVIELFGSHADQLGLLLRHLERLQDEGYRGEAVAVLSTRSADAAVARDLPRPWSDRIGPVDPAVAGRIRTGTIHSFKGLEAPAVILTDIAVLGSSAERNLVYVGCTRARHRLVVLASQGVVPVIQQILMGKGA